MDDESETAVVAAGAADQPWSRSALTSFLSAALEALEEPDEEDDARRLSAIGREDDGLRRLRAGSGAAASATRVRDEPVRASPAMLLDDGCGRFAAQWLVIESCLSKLRRWAASNAALLPFDGLAAAPLAMLDEVDEPKSIDPLRETPPLPPAATRIAAARRFISSMMESAVEGGRAASVEVVELVEANRVPGIEKVKEEGGAVMVDAVVAGGGEPKTNAADELTGIGRAGSTSLPVEAKLLSWTVDLDETRRMPPSPSSPKASW